MKILDIIKSKQDNVQKIIFEHSSKIPLEVSLIRKNDGKDIICVPSQTNCKMGCQFCHLTDTPFPAKNLHWMEIANMVDKVLDNFEHIEQTLLVSYMGAGEPLLNQQNVINSMLAINHWKSYYKTVRFAVSTIIPKISEFDNFTNNVKKASLPVKLHWSMHSTNLMQRKNLMPAATENELAINCLRKYKNETNQLVEIHYTLMEGINDSDKDIENISKSFSPDDGFNFKILKFAQRFDSAQQESSNILKFKNSLKNLGYEVETYSPPGEDIQAACGQFMLGTFVR